MTHSSAIVDPIRAQRRFRLGLLVFSAAYLLVRVPRLTLLPPFNDELIYLRYTQLITQGWEHLFVAYTAVGKQSLYLWLSASVWPLFADPLTAMRATSVACGLGALWATMLLAHKLQGERFPWLPITAGALYVFSPFTVFHERLALYEPLVNLISMLAVFLSLHLVLSRRGRDAMWLGLALGLGLITKYYCFFFLAYPFLAMLDAWLTEKKRPTGRLLALAFGAVALATAVRYAVNIKPFFLIKTGTPSIDITEYLVGDASGVLQRIVPNLRHVGMIYEQYLGLPLLALIVLGAVLIAVRRPAGMLAPLLAAVGATALQVLLTERMIFARYLYFTFPFLLLTALYGLFTAAQWLAPRVLPNIRPERAHPALAGIVVAAIALAYLPTSLAIVRDPANAPLEPVDRWQHVTGWTAGYGLAEARAFMLAEAERVGETLDVFFHYDSLGIPGHYFHLYLGDDPRFRYHLSSWDRRLPLLFFVAQNGVVEHPASNCYDRKETLRPELMKHVYFLGTTPLLDRARFVALNGEPEAEKHFPKPGGESAVVAFKVRVPALGAGGY